MIKILITFGAKNYLEYKKQVYNEVFMQGI